MNVVHLQSHVEIGSRTISSGQIWGGHGAVASFRHSLHRSRGASDHHPVPLHARQNQHGHFPSQNCTNILIVFICLFFFFFFFFFLFAAICFFFFEQQNIFQMSKMRAEQDAMQLLFIISDGWVLQDPTNTTKWIREASANNVSPNKPPWEKLRTRKRESGLYSSKDPLIHTDIYCIHSDWQPRQGYKHTEPSELWCGRWQVGEEVVHDSVPLPLLRHPPRPPKPPPDPCRYCPPVVWNGQADTVVVVM